jgi:EmrB/QacA subfamily drug resistance transporter
MLIKETTAKQKITLFVLCLIVLMLNLDVTVVNLALPSIEKTFQVSVTILAWVISIFIVATASCVIISGILVFLIASLIAAFASHFAILLFGRTLQGIGMALAFPAMFSLIPKLFNQNQRGLAMGILLSMMGIGQSIGPSFGGLLINFYNWRLIFLLNVPICIFVLFASLKLKQRSELSSSVKNIDYLGAMLLFLGMSSLFLLISLFQQDVQFTIMISCLLVMIISLIGFWWREQHLSQPLIDFSLYKNYRFVFLNFVRITLQFSFIALLFLLALLLQNILMYSPLQAGLMILVITLVFAVFSPFAGRAVDRFGPQKPIAIGMLSLALGFSLLIHPTLLSKMFIAFVLIGIGLSFSYSPTMAAIGYIVPIERMGVASGIVLTNTWIGGGLGISFCSVLLHQVSQYDLAVKLKAIYPAVSPQLQTRFIHFVNGGKSLSLIPKLIQNPKLASQLIQLAQTQFIRGFDMAVLLCSVLCFIAVGLSFAIIS